MYEVSLVNSAILITTLYFTTDKVNMYEASLANSAIAWGIEEPVIMSMLERGETLTALATLMYSPYTKQQVNNNTHVLILRQTSYNLGQTFVPYPPYANNDLYYSKKRTYASETVSLHINCGLAYAVFVERQPIFSSRYTSLLARV